MKTYKVHFTNRLIKRLISPDRIKIKSTCVSVHQPEASCINVSNQHVNELQHDQLRILQDSETILNLKDILNFDAVSNLYC